MGSRIALAMAEAVEDGSASLRQALTWHLQSNHFPPVPASMVDPCIEAIEAANDDDWARRIDLPDGVTFRDQTWAPAHAVIEQHHLDSFLIDVDTDEWGDLQS